VSDYETSQRRRNIVVGFFVIIGMGALVWLIFKFGDLPTVVSGIGSFEVYVQFPTAPGVQKDTPVRFCGYQIGRVTAVMAPEPKTDLNTRQEYHQTVAVLSIDKKYANIPSNAEVKLMTRGLGSSYIELKIDPDKLPAPPRDPNLPESCFLLDEMLLQGSAGITSEFFPAESQKKLDDLISSIIAVTGNANDILSNPDNKANLSALLANLSDASGQAGDRLAEGKETLKRVNITLDSMTSAIADARSTFEDYRKLATKGTDAIDGFNDRSERLVMALVVTSEHLGESAAQLRLLLQKVNEGKGSAGRFVTDGKLYEKLLENSDQLKVTLQEIKEFVEQAKEKGLHIKL